MKQQNQQTKQRGRVPPSGGQGVQEGQHDTSNTKPINSVLSASLREALGLQKIETKNMKQTNN